MFYTAFQKQQSLVLVVEKISCSCYNLGERSVGLVAKVKNRMKLKNVEMALGSPPLSVMNHNTYFKDAIEQFIRYQGSQLHRL